MKAFLGVLISASVAAIPLAASADPWKDESGHGKRHKHGHDRGEYKEEYWDGSCKVERKFERNGEYKEERKCKPPRHSHRGPRHEHYEPAPVYVPAPPVVVEPGVTIHGTIRLP